jgi:hypothetical protein
MIAPLKRLWYLDISEWFITPFQPSATSKLFGYNVWGALYELRLDGKWTETCISVNGIWNLILRSFTIRLIPIFYIHSVTTSRGLPKSLVIDHNWGSFLVPEFIGIYIIRSYLGNALLHFSFLILYTFGRTSYVGDQSVARPLPTHRMNESIQASSGIQTHDPCSGERIQFMP